VSEFQKTDPIPCLEVSAVCESSPALHAAGETIVAPQPAEVEATLSDVNRVQVNLETPGLAFQVQTLIPQNSQVTELTARLEMAITLLRETLDKLEIAHTRVGFLEAQVLQRDQVIEQLCKNEAK
jgi:hypothetical protein